MQTIPGSPVSGNPSPTVAALLDAYGARDDAVLVAEGDRARTERTDSDGVRRHVAEHLAGGARAGVFLLRDGRCRVGVIDLDTHGPHARKDPGADAAALVKVLRGLGLDALVEVTRRAGRHVSVLFEQAVPASDVRALLAGALRQVGIEPEAVEVFPKQENEADGLGNGLWLPYQGNAPEGRTVYLGPDGRPSSLAQFLGDAEDCAATAVDLTAALGKLGAMPPPATKVARPAGPMDRLLAAVAATAGAKRRGDKVEVRCPFHQPDNAASAVVFPSGKLHCSACGRSWSLPEWTLSREGRAVIGDDLAAELAALRERATAPAGDVETVVTPLGDVKPERVSWLWWGRLPRGKLVVLKGDPGVGKTTIAVDACARVSAGMPFPGDVDQRESADALFITAEDGLGDTIVPRLQAAGANIARVHTIKVREHGLERLPELSIEDLTRIEAVVREKGVALVVFDPLAAFVPDRVDAHRDHHIRRVLAPLASLAERTGATVVVIQHLNKSSTQGSLYRGGGSIGVAAAARSVLFAAKDPQDEGQRVLAVDKCNLSAPAPALAYELVEAFVDGADGEQVETARVEWLGESDYSVDALLAIPATADEKSAVDEAWGFLCQVLKVWRPVREVQAEARQAGVSWDSVRRAMKAHGVKPRKRPGKGGPWELPPVGNEGAGKGAQASMPFTPSPPSASSTPYSPNGGKDEEGKEGKEDLEGSGDPHLSPQAGPEVAP